MRTLEKQELHNLLSWSEDIVAQYVKRVLQNQSYLVTEKREDYIFAAPTGPPLPVCLVVHMDTVRTRRNKPVRLCATPEFVYNENGILGADDRAGVSIVLQLLRRLPRQPYVLFTHGEETGCTGARAACASGVLTPHLRNINAFVSYDRRGFNECVTYTPRVPAALTGIFSLFGYEGRTGSTSDVRVLSDKTGIAHVNLSAGYVDQHTNNEILFYKGVDFAVSSGVQILPRIRSLYVLDPPATNTAYSGRGTTPAMHVCAVCGEKKYSADWRPTLGERVCFTCLSNIRNLAPRGSSDAIAYKLFLANKKTTCPKCGQVGASYAKEKDEYTCTCGTSFTIESGQKVWYTYVQDGEDLGCWVQHKSCVYPASPKTIPATCSCCNSERRVYYVKGTDQWFCTTCLIQLRNAGTITKEQVSEAVRARNQIPF